MLALIPARGGSKGLPGKNIRPLCGRPLIEYTIEAALHSDLVTDVIVSTESKEIADIALSAGASVPFMRPVELASDTSLGLDTYIYTCDRLIKELGAKIPNIIILQPTSPLRTTDDIDNATMLFKQKAANAVISVVENPFPDQWQNRIDEYGVLHNNVNKSDFMIKNRQDYDKSYLFNGAIYVFDYNFIRTCRTYYSERTFAYVMPRERSIDIDDLLDFEFAEFLMMRRFDG